MLPDGRITIQGRSAEIVRVFYYLGRIFDTYPDVVLWLCTEHPELQARPIDLLGTTDSARSVREYLEYIHSRGA